MRKYITEKVGIVELFQIIITAVIVALGYYEFSTDFRWNDAVDEMGLNVCVEINRRICRIDNTTKVMFESECKPRLDIHDLKSCNEVVHQKYLRKTDTPWRVNMSATGKVHFIRTFILTNLKRYTYSEVGFMVLVHLILLALCSHLIISHLPKISRNIYLRTKWNAAVQGIIMFAAGFAAVFLAISTNTIDSKYDLISNRIQPCSMLRFCDRGIKSHDQVDIDTELIINKALDDSYACQQVYAKRACCVLLMILIGMCTVMIFMAMELTTKYEEEMEDDEHGGLEEHDTGLDTLIEDQNVDFDEPVVQDNNATQLASVEHDRLSIFSLMLDPT